MLYKNQTKVPDSLLKPLILLAAKRVGAKHKALPITIVASQGASTSGTLTRRNRVILRIRLPRLTTTQRRWSATGEAARQFVLRDLANLDPLRLAEDFYAVAVHEFTHVADWQAGRTFHRLLPYRQRPQEIRAYEAQATTFERRTKGEAKAILALALWLQRYQNEQVAKLSTA